MSVCSHRPAFGAFCRFLFLGVSPRCRRCRALLKEENDLVNYLAAIAPLLLTLVVALQMGVSVASLPLPLILIAALAGVVAAYFTTSFAEQYPRDKPL